MVYGTLKNCDLGNDLWYWVYHITPNLHQSSSKLQSFRLLRSDCSWRFTLAVFAACLLFLACRLFRGHSPTSTCISLRTENRSRKTHVFEYRDCGVGWGGHVNVPCTSYMIYWHAAEISGIVYYVTCCDAAESGI